MNKKLQIFLLTIIVIIAFVLRLWQLGAVPQSPDWDEVALGYNAYSITQTGRDEYGEFLPVVIKSFNDYKPALYTYLIIPFIKLFGLTTFAVRLPSALFGTLAVLATYFLVKELFVVNAKNSKRQMTIPFVAACLLAISPLSIQFSRVAFESNVGDALNIFAALFFLKGLKKPWFLSLSAASAALSLHAYQSEKVFTPLFMLALVIIFYRELRRVALTKIIAAIIVGILVALPLLIMMITTPEVLLRAKGTSILQSQTTLLKEQIFLKDYDTEQGDTLGLLFNNRRIIYLKEVFSGYLSHYNLNWSFITGDIVRHHPPSMGMLYLWELPFLFIGIYFFLFGPFPKKTKLFLFTWFLLVPVPAAFTNGVPHAVRTLNFLPTFQIFIAIGLVTAFSFIKKYQVLKLLAISYLLFIVFNFLYYLNQYFVQQNYFHATEWQYGYQEAVMYSQEIKNNYKKIVVSDQSPLDQSYIFFLFYLKYPPIDYQRAQNYTFGSYQFRPIRWASEEKSQDILYIGRPDDFPEGIKTKKVIYYPDGKQAFLFVEGE